MRGCGGERVIRSLLSYSRRMSARAIVSTLAYKIKQDAETEAYRHYIAHCLRIITENTAAPADYYSYGQTGSYVPVEFDELINKKMTKPHTPGEIADKIREKMR